MAFDLSTLEPGRQKQEDGVSVRIKLPDGTDSDIVLTVASYESERVKRTAREIGNKALLEQKRNPRKGESVEAIEDRTFAIAISSIVGWEGIEMDGKPLPFTRENVRMVLEKFPFIAEQVDAAASDRALFFGN